MNRRQVFQRMFIAMMTVLALGVLVFDTTLAGNDRVSPRIVSMGRTFVASSRGLDAIGLNPANLALDDRGNTVKFQFAPFGFSIGSELMNLKIY